MSCEHINKVYVPAEASNGPNLPPGGIYTPAHWFCEDCGADITEDMEGGDEE